MIKLNLAKGYFFITDGNGQIYPGWVGDNAPSYPDLPEPSFIYQKCRNKDLTPERTIDIMLQIFHRQRFIWYGFLFDQDLVVGLVGPRGSGKSVGGAAIAIYDFLLCGKPVFSNMDIAVTVRYKEASKEFKSISLDKTSLLDVRDQEQMYRNCLVFLDEANIEMAESQRTMGNKALWFSYALQQARKRHLSLIHTEQSEYHVTERLRWQTNVFISCKDAAYQHGTPRPGELGRRSFWKIHDAMGTINGQIYNDERMVVQEGTFHMTPFWHCFDTERIQTGETELPDFKKQGLNLFLDPEERLEAVIKENPDGVKILRAYGQQGKRTRLWKDVLWEHLGISDKIGEQTRIGSQVINVGAKHGKSTGDRLFYNLPPLSDLGENGE